MNNYGSKSAKILASYKEQKKSSVKDFIVQHAARIQKILIPYFGMTEDVKTKENQAIFVPYISKVRCLIQDAQEYASHYNDIDIQDYCFQLLRPKLGKEAYYSKPDVIESLRKESSYYYLYVLSHSIVSHSSDIVFDFKQIMESNSKCKENYLQLQTCQYNRYPFMDSDSNDFIVFSVLMEMDHKSIQNQIKDCIYTNSDKDYKHLDKINLEQFHLYNDLKQEINRSKYIQEFAFIFLLEYFKDRFFIASYSPYTLLVEDEVVSLIQMNSKYFQTKQTEEQTRTEVNNLIDEIQQGNYESIQNEYKTILVALHKDASILNASFESELLEKYKDKLIEIVCQSNTFFTMTKESQIQFILRNVYTLYLMNQHVENNMASFYEERLQQKEEQIKDLEKQLSLKDQQIQSLQQDTSHKVSQAKLQSSKENIQTISSLEKLMASQKEEIEELRNQNQEVYKLRECLFEQNEVDSYGEIDGSILQHKNILIVGGHENLIKSVKKKYPNFQYVDGNAKGIDRKVLKEVDYVFFMYKHMSHNIYETIIPMLIQDHISFDYLSSTNIDRIEMEIIHKIK